jgi:predicted glycosyltransferase
MSKPVLLHYCQHTHDAGSLVRAFAIANRLTHRFRVVILNGGEPPAGLAVPTDVELVQLPPLSLGIDSNVMSIHDSVTLRSDIASRCEIILAKYAQRSPSVILVDTFPFGHEILADELMPLIERARHSMSSQPLLICSVAEIASGEGHGKQDHDDRITAVLDKYFDAVIVHTDPSFARLGEFLQPRDTLTIPVYHSGFVLREREELPLAGRRDGRVLVSAGSGIDGASLFRAAIEAHRILWDVVRLPMTLVAGPSLPDEDWQKLDSAAAELPALRLIRSLPDLGTELAKVRWAVCDCSYNTTVDVLATRVSALLVPCGNGHESVHADRSQRLTYWHAARMLMPHHLNGASLANNIHQLMKFAPSASSFNMDGAEITANVIYHLSLSEDIRPDNLTSATFSDHPRTQ